MEESKIIWVWKIIGEEKFEIDFSKLKEDFGCLSVEKIIGFQASKGLASIPDTEQNKVYLQIFKEGEEIKYYVGQTTASRNHNRINPKWTLTIDIEKKELLTHRALDILENLIMNETEKLFKKYRVSATSTNINKNRVPDTHVEKFEKTIKQIKQQFLTFFNFLFVFLTKFLPKSKNYEYYNHDSNKPLITAEEVAASPETPDKLSKVRWWTLKLKSYQDIKAQIYSQKPFKCKLKRGSSYKVIFCDRGNKSDKEQDRLIEIRNQYKSYKEQKKLMINDSNLWNGLNNKSVIVCQDITFKTLNKLVIFLKYIATVSAWETEFEYAEDITGKRLNAHQFRSRFNPKQKPKKK